jgi:hypothetical protein
MAGLYNSIAATRYAQGRLWTPALSLDLMGNDWAVLGTPFGFISDQNSIGNPGTGNWVAALDASVITFPSDYLLDDEYDSLEVALALRWQGRKDTIGTPNLEYRFLADGNTSSVSDQISGTSYEWTSSMVATWPAGTVPTGAITITHQVRFTATSPAKTAFSRRISTEDVPNCVFYVRAT